MQQHKLSNIYHKDDPVYYIFHMEFHFPVYSTL